MAGKVTRPALLAGARAPSADGAAVYRGATGPWSPSGLLGCDATTDPTQTGPVPLPVRVPGGAARALAGASRDRPRSRRIDRDGRPAALPVGPDRRRDRPPARGGAAAPGPASAPERRGGARHDRLGAQRRRPELRAPGRRARRDRHRRRPARRGRDRRRVGVAAGRGAARRARVGDRRHARGLDRGDARRRRPRGPQLARGLARSRRSPDSPRSRSSGSGRRIARRRPHAGAWAHGAIPWSRGSPRASCSPTPPGPAC